MFLTGRLTHDRHSLLDRLATEWITIAQSSSGALALKRWQGAEPALRRHRALAEIPDSLPVAPPEPDDRGALLQALLRLSDDAVAARTLLQCLLPRIRHERVNLPRYGHGLSERSQSVEDTFADLVAECYFAICRHAGRDLGPDANVSRLILQTATRRLRTIRQAQRRYWERTESLDVPVPPAALQAALADHRPARSDAEQLALSVVEAVQRRGLERSDAQLIYATRVTGLPASRAARMQGMKPKSVYYALQSAEQELLRRTA
jgi:DNA-directed RNA polymerase specialized sigma24 family protein